VGVPQIMEVQPAVLRPQVRQLGLGQRPLPDAREVIPRDRPGLSGVKG
jgi:hypothetical protein